MARMKVLLKEDVINLGLAGEVHSVAAGFARNYLLPRGEAIPATPAALKQAEGIRAAATRKRAQERANAEAQATVISQQRLLFQVRAGDNNRLYGSVTNSDIAEKLAALVEFEVDRRRVLLDAAIRDLGIHQVTIRLMQDVNATFAVAIVREGETWEDAEKRHNVAKAKSAANNLMQENAEAQAEAEEVA